MDGSGDGAHTYQFQATDNAGNVSSIGTCTVKIDTQGPQTAAPGLQSDDRSGWRTTAQTLTLTATDVAGSGIATTYYTVDGGARQTYGTSFSVSGSGAIA